jgi:hypothetical protein
VPNWHFRQNYGISSNFVDLVDFSPKWRQSLATITQLPPQPDRFSLHYDAHLYSRRRHPVSAQRQPDGTYSTPGWSFEDYTRGHIVERKIGAGRRANPPLWVFDAVQLRERVLFVSEKRAGYRTPQTGTYEERLERIRKKNNLIRPRLIVILDKLCSEYVGLKVTSQVLQTLLDADGGWRLRLRILIHG